MDLETLVENVESDSTISKEAKETNITFSNGDDMADFFTANASLMRHALMHSDIEVDSLTVQDRDDGTYSGVGPDEYTEDDGAIVGVVAQFPIGLMKLGKSARKSNSRSHVISKQADVSIQE